MNPLVSVIMPAYNGEKYIGFAIDSILKQTYSNLELVIVEDGSTDETLKIIKQFNDSRIRLFINELNKGIAYSTNKAIENSKGKYIALLDDDDVAAIDRLEKQVDFLENHSEIDIIGGRSANIDENGKLIGFSDTPRKNPKYVKALLLFEYVGFYNGTAMIRKDFIDENDLKYRENCLGMQDYMFFIESSKVGKISSIDEILLYHRRHSKNETKRVLDNHFEKRFSLCAEMQAYSIRKSGFVLSEQKMQILQNMLWNPYKRVFSLNDIEILYDIFQEMLIQAKEMQIDYYSELEYLCKKKLGDVLLKSSIFI